MDPIVTPAWKDKAVYAAVLAPLFALLVPLLNAKLALDLNPSTIDTFVAGILAGGVAYIAGHKWKTGTMGKAQIEAGGIPGTQTIAAGVLAKLDSLKTKPSGGFAKLHLLMVVALVLTAVLWSRPAHAQGFGYSVGPTIPFLEVDPGNPNPISIAPGAGVQVALTHSMFSATFLGKTWNLLAVDAMAFGSVISGVSGQQFGAFSGAVAVCTLSSLVCVGGGKHLVSTGGAFTSGGWFAVLALSINFGLTPPVPSMADGIRPGSAEYAKAYDDAELPLPPANTVAF